MIKVGTSGESSKINVSQESSAIQQIIIKNEDPSTQLKIGAQTASHKIEIATEACATDIKVGIPCPYKQELAISLETKVPKELSILPQAPESTFTEVENMRKGRIYIDLDNTPTYATIEDLKKLNTKTIFVNSLDDNETKNLSNFDMIMLNIKEK